MDNRAIGPNAGPCPDCGRWTEYGLCPNGCHIARLKVACTNCGKTKGEHTHLGSAWSGILICPSALFKAGAK